MWGEPPVDAPGVEQAMFHLPAGTVTFLLADVEGSTRLWESDPEAMAVAVARHYELLDAAVALHGGVRPLEQGEGDSVVAAFSRATDALTAALDTQLAFSAEAWPTASPLRVRIALNTAEAQLRDEGNYFGVAVNRCARLLGIAHGGQVVVSAVTRNLVLDRLPQGMGLTDLGVHRLRDLGRPEHVFGLAHPDLPGEFPPLRSLDTLPNNLPSQLTSFVGRRDEQARVSELLANTRLLTLTGAGGCGKTRLALQAAAEVLDDKPDGAWWVELARLSEPDLLPAALIGAMGLWEVPGWTPQEALIDHLRTRSVLIVLDNCEHLLAECAALVEALLRACPSLTVLATSREPLGVAGEVSWRVPSMSLPAEPNREPIESLRQCDAVRLFIERGLQVRPNFTVTSDNAPSVAQICSDLDGIPLAIELAAARVRMMAPDQIAKGLGDRFHLLTGGSRSAMPRHRTLEASIAWSHELLNDAEAMLFWRLSTFVGGWSLDAAEEVCSGDGIETYGVLDLLTALVDKSLVTTDEAEGEVRYGLLNSVRQYAAARLAESGEGDALRSRHLAFYLAVAEAAEPEVFRASRDDPVLRRLADDVPNLRAALDWAAATDPDAGLRIAAALSLFWAFTGRYGEGEAGYARALEAAGDEPSPLRARVLAARAYLGVLGGAFLEAPGWAQAALDVGKACGDLRAQARAHASIGLVVTAYDPAGGQPVLERGVELARQAGDDACLADALIHLASCLLFQDRHDDLVPVLDEAYAIAGRMGYRWGAAWYWLILGRATKLQGGLEEAVDQFERMMAASHDVGDPVTTVLSAAALATTVLELGQAEVARDLVSGPLEHATETGAGLIKGFANQVLAKVDIVHGHLSEARRHLEQAIEWDSMGLAYFLPEHLSLMAWLECQEGNLEAARERACDGLEVARRVGSGWAQAYVERILTRLALAGGDAGEAERHAHEALGHLLPMRLRLGIPDCLGLLAAVAAEQESFDEAARLLGAAAGGRQALGIVRVPPEPEFWAGVESTARMALGEEAYDQAFAAGATLSMDEAVAYARRARGERKRPSAGWASLTPTELDVVGIAALGCTNRQIGERLFISAGTVKVHLAHIFAKLGISTRAQLASEATRRGIGAP